MSSQNDVNHLVNTAAATLCMMSGAPTTSVQMLCKAGSAAQSDGYKVTLPEATAPIKRFMVTSARVKLSAALDRGVIVACDALQFSNNNASILINTPIGEFKRIMSLATLVPTSSTTLQVQGSSTSTIFNGHWDEFSSLYIQFYDDYGNLLTETSTPAISEWAISIVVFTE